MKKLINWWKITVPRWVVTKVKTWPFWGKIILSIFLAIPEWLIFIAIILLIDKLIHG